MSSSRVYEYGARRPSTNLDRVREQMSLAHKYGNRLVEIELARRAGVREAMGCYPDVRQLAESVASIELELETVRTTLQQERQRVRGSAPVETKEAKAAAKDILARLRDARAAWKLAKKAAVQDPLVKELMAAAEAVSDAAVKKARAESGLYWGSYLQVEQAAEQQRKGLFDPKFARWDGSGHLAVQLQGGIDTKDIFEPDTRAYVDALDPMVWEKAALRLASRDLETSRARGEGSSSPQDETRSSHRYGSSSPQDETSPATPARGEGKRMLRRTTVHLRIGTVEGGRGPVYADIPILMHRPLPPGRVKWVHLLRTMIADHERWVVQFVVELDEAAASRARSAEACGGAAPSGVVGIDVGWRLLEDGSLRVATAVDSDGGERELTLPKRLLEKDEHTAGLQQLRARLMNEMKERLLATRPAEGADWWQHVHLWRSPSRLHRLLAGEDAAALDEVIVSDIRAFLKQDRHLWQWQEHERIKVRRQRKEMFRLFAVDVARRHSRVAIESFDLRAVAKRGNPEDGTTTDSRDYQRLRGLACISELRGALTQACAKRDVEVVELPAAYTTLDCSFCKQRCSFNAAAQLKHTCEHCGVTWDQDVNAARNLTAAALVTPVKEKVVKVKRSRFAKRTPAEPAETAAV